MAIEEITSFGATDIGKRRQVNEDYFQILPEKKLYMVADGMGGHNAGLVASKYAIQAIENYFSTQLITQIRSNDLHIKEAIFNSILTAHTEIKKISKTKPNYEGMGCAMVTAFINGNFLHIGHVGDSRAYICNVRGIKLLTTDHSFVMKQVKDGKMTSEEARFSPLRNRLNQAIGASVDIKPDYHLYPLEHGDKILLCSDGLWDMFTDEQIFYILIHDRPAKDLCETLITMANNAGGHDNITAVVIIYENPPIKEEEIHELIVE
jgi:protein phosphatase